MSDTPRTWILEPDWKMGGSQVRQPTKLVEKAAYDELKAERDEAKDGEQKALDEIVRTVAAYEAGPIAERDEAVKLLLEAVEMAEDIWAASSGRFGAGKPKLDKWREFLAHSDSPEAKP